MSHFTNIPGLPGGPLETSFPLHLLIVPPWRTRNRPGIKARHPRISIQHETANLRTFAAAEARYLYNGAGGRQASWHATVDHMEGWISLPADEVGWQAGDGSGPGNYNGFAVERSVHHSIISDASTDRLCRRNCAELEGKVAARLNAPPPARQHNHFSGKDCPHYIRARDQWDDYLDDWHQFNTMERSAMGDAPDDDGVINIGDTIRTLVSLNLRQSANTSAPVIATLPIGAELVVNGRWSSADGYGWLPVATAYGDGAVAMGDADGPYIAKVADAPTVPIEPEPEYVDAVPIPALLDTDLSKYDTAEGITTDDTGHDFVFVADVIEFTAVTVAGEYAVDNPRPIHAPYQIGDRCIAAWLVENRSGVWHYVLAGGDDEWVRVPYAATRRVSDAPLLGDEWGDEEADISDVINALEDVTGDEIIDNSK